MNRNDRRIVRAALKGTGRRIRNTPNDDSSDKQPEPQTASELVASHELAAAFHSNCGRGD